MPPAQRGEVLWGGMQLQVSSTGTSISEIIEETELRNQGFGSDQKCLSYLLRYLSTQ